MSAEHSQQGGFTLLEITFAMAIFMIVLGIVAQSLVYSFHVLVLEQQRTNALNGCKSVLSTLRQVSYSGLATAACTEEDPLFPCVVLTWVQAFPKTLDEIQENDMERFGPFFSLPQQQYEITCLDTDGNPAQASAALNGNSNPAVVTVNTTWTGMRERNYTLSATAMITDR